MPVGLVLVSFLLLCQAVVALRAGRITTAGILLGVLGYATLTLHRWYRARRTTGAGTSEDGPAAPGGVLVAIVYPDEVDRLGRLLASVEPAARPMMVLAVGAVSSSEETEPGTASASAERFLRARDPRLDAQLVRVVAAAGVPIVLMHAAGRDPALVVLDLALKLRASRVVVLRGEDTSIQEQLRVCSAVWEGLPSPRPGLHVEMVSADGDTPPLVIELGPTLAGQPAS